MRKHFITKIQETRCSAIKTFFKNYFLIFKVVINYDS